MLTIEIHVISGSAILLAAVVVVDQKVNDSASAWPLSASSSGIISKLITDFSFGWLCLLYCSLHQHTTESYNFSQFKFKVGVFFWCRDFLLFGHLYYIPGLLHCIGTWFSGFNLLLLHYDIQTDTRQLTLTRSHFLIKYYIKIDLTHFGYK